MAQARTIEPATAGDSARRSGKISGGSAPGDGSGVRRLHRLLDLPRLLQRRLPVGMDTDVLPDHSYMISPFYSPLILFLPPVLAWVSPAFLILWAPAGFRVTCYYYRKAYYRAFFLDPVACAVGEPSSFCGFHRAGNTRGRRGS